MLQPSGFACLIFSPLPAAVNYHYQHATSLLCLHQCPLSATLCYSAGQDFLSIAYPQTLCVN